MKIANYGCAFMDGQVLNSSCLDVLVLDDPDLIFFLGGSLVGNSRELSCEPSLSLLLVDNLILLNITFGELVGPSWDAVKLPIVTSSTLCVFPAGTGGVVEIDILMGRALLVDTLILHLTDIIYYFF